MKRRGRPPGSRKLPDEFYSDLHYLFDLWRSRVRMPYIVFDPNVSMPYIEDDPTVRGRWRQHISNMCRNIFSDKVRKQGGIRWIDRKTGKIVAEITDESTLRRRMYQAWSRKKPLYSFSTADAGAVMLEAGKIAARYFSAGGEPRRTDFWVGDKKLSK
jgi:hypothetical protein